MALVCLTTDHSSLKHTRDAEDREGTDRFPETDFACYFFEVLLVSCLSLKNLLLQFLIQER